MTARFRELDGLRGLAAVAVVWNHLTVGYDSKYSDSQSPVDFAWGAYGVQLFFFISGFVILMSARRARRPSDFVISRISRLYPVYWIALTMSIVLSVLFTVPHTEIGWTNRLLNYLMVQRWFLIPNVDEVYWTLAIEMQFYLFMFVLVVATRNRLHDRVVVWAAAGWLAVAVAVAVWASPASRGVGAQFVDTPVKLVLNMVLAEWGPLFVAGMFAYFGRSDRRFRPWAFVAVLLGALVAALLHSWPQAVAVFCLGLVFLVVAFRGRTRALLWRPVQWYGKISYSLYIGHLIPGNLMVHALHPLIGRGMAMVVAFMGVTLIGWALYEIGEVRGTTLFKRRLEKRRRRSPQHDSSATSGLREGDVR